MVSSICDIPALDARIIVALERHRTYVLPVLRRPSLLPELQTVARAAIIDLVSGELLSAFRANVFIYGALPEAQPFFIPAIRNE